MKTLNKETTAITPQALDEFKALVDNYERRVPVQSRRPLLSAFQTELHNALDLSPESEYQAQDVIAFMFEICEFCDKIATPWRRKEYIAYRNSNKKLQEARCCTLSESV